MRDVAILDIPDYSWGMCKAPGRLNTTFLIKSVKPGKAGINRFEQKAGGWREAVLSTFITFNQKPALNQEALDHPGNPGRGPL